MKNLKRRLDVLESAERSGPRWPDMTAALMLSYATPEERAEWEASGRPELGRATWQQVLDQVYADYD